MTGAPVPAGADAVVPFEETSEVHDPASAATEYVRMYVAPSAGANIRPAGEDMFRGDLVLAAGTLVNPGAVGVLATVGAASVAVHRRPRVAILATGDELVEAAGGEPLLLPIVRDSEAALLAAIDQGLAAGADLFLTSGGVSVGDYDVVKQVLEREGQLAFWRVNMRPGKPLAFGHLRGVPLIGLPGNPVSAMVCFEIFARPALLRLQGRPDIFRPAVSARYRGEPLRAADRRQYLRAVVRVEAGGYVAELTGGQGSGLVSSMARANALLIVPEGGPAVAPDAAVSVLLLDQLAGQA
jgi:molybdopterin molybdotransferase